MKPGFKCTALLLFTLTPAFAHRLDEYLQGTIISITKDQVEAQITLTPGVAVFPTLLKVIDTDADGVISAPEQQNYARSVLRDLTLKIDGQALTPQLLSSAFPALQEMKEGRGEIRLQIKAMLPRGGSNRKLTFENRHQSQLAAYQVNSLVPQDPNIRITGQNRNYSQSLFELDFAQTNLRAPFGTLGILLCAGLTLIWRRSVKTTLRKES